MLSKKAKLIFTTGVIVSIVGTIVAIYIGYYFFSDRARVFWIFSAYIVVVASIFVFMVHRYVKIYIT